MFQQWTRVIWSLALFSSCGLLAASLGGLSPSVAEAAPGTNPKHDVVLADGFDEIEGLLVEQDGSILRYTVTDPEKTFMIFGYPADEDAGERLEPCVDCGEAPTVQTCLVDKSVKVHADKPSSVWEMDVRLVCEAGICLPCLGLPGNCTEPLPGPNPEPLPFGAVIQDHEALQEMSEEFGWGFKK